MIGQFTVDALMPLIVVNDNIHCMRLRPICVVGVMVIANIEITLALYHKRLDEGIGHGVGLRLVGVFYKSVELIDARRLGIDTNAQRCQQYEGGKSFRHLFTW